VAITFMAAHGGGLINAPMLAGRLDALGIAPMVPVDLSDPLRPGISARDRAATIRLLADPSSVAPDFRQPGHVLPVAAVSAGVLERAAPAEAAIDLAVLAGATPAGAFCTILDEDGEVARLTELLRFAERHGLPAITIQDLIAYRHRTDRRVIRAVETRMPLAQGDFTVIGYRDTLDGREHLAAVLGDVRDRPGVLVRMHSKCLMGDVFGSRRCRCGAQLELALSRIAEEGSGAVVYVRGHEGTCNGGSAGRGTDVAADDAGLQILQDLGIREMRLLTHDGPLHAVLEEGGLAIRECLPLVA
jgi:3,4-dihydroxy 2-butanone 4-phosphate synthase/GTP cyclohydrolase II